MNRNLTIIALISLVAMFTSCDTKTVAPATKHATTTTSVKPTIVYVNIDSVAINYKMYKDLIKEFTVKAEKAQKELEGRATTFQKELQSFENEVKNGLITRTGAMEKEQQLQVKQQEIMQYREQVLGKLSEEETVMTNKIRYNIQQFIEKFNDEAKYDMIISTSSASGTVLTANPNLDITLDILNGLNAEYVPEKKK